LVFVLLIKNEPLQDQQSKTKEQIRFSKLFSIEQ